MGKVSASREMNVPAEKVWQVLADFGGIYKYHPGVETSPLLSENNEGLGARRICHFYDKSSVVEEVVDWSEGRKLTVELSEGSLPFKSARATFTIEPTGGEVSRVTLSMDFVVKYGPIGWVMEKAMINAKMRGIFTTVLESLERHAATGELIGRDGIGLGDKNAARLQAAS